MLLHLQSTPPLLDQARTRHSKNVPKLWCVLLSPFSSVQSLFVRDKAFANRAICLPHQNTGKLSLNSDKNTLLDQSAMGQQLTLVSLAMYFH